MANAMERRGPPRGGKAIAKLRSSRRRMPARCPERASAEAREGSDRNTRKARA